jgi:hypothetical protein
MHIPDPDRSPSPTDSFYAMSDDEEGEYNTIRHSSSGRGVKLLYTKSKVYVHPTPSSKDNIPGFIALVQQKNASPLSDNRPTSASSSHKPASSDLLLAWIPESSLGDSYDTYVKVDLSDSSSPPKQSYLVPPPPTTYVGSTSGSGYAFAVPVSEIYSLLVRPPSIGWWFGSVVINTRSGEGSYPALFFHDSECQSTIMQRKRLARESFDPFPEDGIDNMFWGGDEVLRWLKRYVNVVRSTADQSAYLVEPTEEDRLGFGDKLPKSPTLATSGEGAGSSNAASTLKRTGDAAMDPVTKALKEARWNFLEKLSQVTTFTRRTAQAVAENPKVPPQVRRLIQNPEVQTLQEEFDSARIYLARWAMSIAEQSERERNQRIWTAKDVLETEDGELGEFEILSVEAGGPSLAEKRRPVTKEEWAGWFDDRHGRLNITPDEVKERIFHGGLNKDDGVRKEAWLFLLGVYDWDSSRDERHARVNSLRDEFIRLKGRWWEKLVVGQGTTEESEWWRDQRNRIEKDVHRTDRQIPLFEGEDLPHPDPNSPFSDVGTNVHLEQMKDMLLTYNEYNKDLGYVQGMSDLLAPIYAVMQDDAVAFWAFVGFMERMERNFLRDQSGMRAQLVTLDQLVQLLDPKLYLHLQSAESTNFFFFFRMLLVWYKREFEWFDVLRLWEGLWTDALSSQFHIFIALAILEKHREVIMKHLKHFDEVLKYVNELSGSIDLESTLIRAEALFRRFQRTVEAVDRKSSFPAPSNTRQRISSASKDATSPTSDTAPSTSSPTNAAPSSSSRRVSRPNPAAGTSNVRVTTTGSGSATASGADARRRASQSQSGASTAATATSPSAGPARDERVISNELRKLLSRKVEKMNKKEVVKHGGGVGS